jgi:hypothetical protein
MASGFLGLQNPWAQSPMQSLTAMAQPDPETTGAIPPAATPPQAAPAAAPAAPERGFGGVLSDMMSGRGIMGAQAGDDKVDPSTGATSGQMRSANMSSMMQFGLTLLAAGMRQSDDQRAAILSKAPGLLNNTDQINSFAKTRLEMANARLAERKQQQAEQKAAYVRSLLGGSGAATLGTSSGAGAPGPAASAPGTLAPIAAPAVADASDGAVAPVSPGTPPTAAPAQGNSVTAGMSPGEVAAIGGMDDEKALETLARRRGEIDGQETMGTPFADPATGQQMAPILKGGKQVRVQALGHLQATVADEGDKRVTRQNGKVTAISDIPEDPQDKEERTASVGIRTKRAAALNEGRANIEGLNAALPRLAKAEKDVRDGKTITGFGADYREQASTLLGSLNMLSDAGREELRRTGDVDGILKQAGGEFAKQYYGPQISNADVENAQKAIGGLKNGDHAVVADALKRIRTGYVQKIDAYNRDADDHNGRLSGIRSEGLRKDLEVRKVERQRAPDEYSEAERAAARAELQRRRAAAGGQ